MAHYSLDTLHRRQRYKLIAGAIVPRPIALVTTQSADGSCNAAPFGAFNYVSKDSPLIVLGLEVHDDVVDAETLRIDSNAIARSAGCSARSTAAPATSSRARR